MHIFFISLANAAGFCERYREQLPSATLRMQGSLIERLRQLMAQDFYENCLNLLAKAGGDPRNISMIELSNPILKNYASIEQNRNLFLGLVNEVVSVLGAEAVGETSDANVRFKNQRMGLQEFNAWVNVGLYYRTLRVFAEGLPENNTPNLFDRILNYFAQVKDYQPDGKTIAGLPSLGGVFSQTDQGDLYLTPGWMQEKEPWIPSPTNSGDGKNYLRVSAIPSDVNTNRKSTLFIIPVLASFKNEGEYWKDYWSVKQSRQTMLESLTSFFAKMQNLQNFLHVPNIRREIELSFVYIIPIFTNETVDSRGVTEVGLTRSALMGILEPIPGKLLFPVDTTIHNYYTFKRHDILHLTELLDGLFSNSSSSTDNYFLPDFKVPLEKLVLIDAVLKKWLEMYQQMGLNLPDSYFEESAIKMDERINKLAQYILWMILTHEETDYLKDYFYEINNNVDIFFDGIIDRYLEPGYLGSWEEWKFLVPKQLFSDPLSFPKFPKTLVKQKILIFLKISGLSDYLRCGANVTSLGPTL